MNSAAIALRPLIEAYAPLGPTPNADGWGIPFLSDSGLGTDLKLAIAAVDVYAMSDADYDSFHRTLHTLYCEAR